MFEAPVVERSVILELERAQRVGHTLDRVRLAVRPVVGRVEDPLVARALMRHTADPIEDRVSHGHHRMRHVDLGAQDLVAVTERAVAHLVEQAEVLLRRTATEGAVLPGFAEATALGRDGLGVLVVDVGEALLDQRLGPLVELAEVVGGVEHAPRLEAEPREIVVDGVDELVVLGGGVGVVEAQVAGPAELLGHPEVRADRLGVADVEVAVRLGWESGLDPAVEGPRLVVGADLVADEVLADRVFGCVAHRLLLLPHRRLARIVAVRRASA